MALVSNKILLNETPNPTRQMGLRHTLTLIVWHSKQQVSASG